LSVFISSSLHIKDERKKLSAQYILNIVNVPAPVIRLVAGEFNGVFSDFLLLQVGSFTGSGKRISPMEWEKVLLGFNQIMELDPYFEQTYLMAQSEMAWDARMPEEAIKLLGKARKCRPWDFRPGYFIAFDYYYFLNDYEKASREFFEAAKVKDAPIILALLGSRFSVKEGKTQASILTLESMLTQTNLTEDNVKEIKNRIIALKGVEIIESAVDEYVKKFGKKPETINDIVEKGIIRQLPQNPYSASYTYNSNNNEVRFDGVNGVLKE
jgi:tetratricopeptide (TPR) repeat protein